MAKKGKKSKGKKKGKSTSGGSSTTFVSAHDFHERADADVTSSAASSWLLIEIALVNWAHMHFQVHAHIDNSMLWLSQTIQERTGSIEGLVLYRDPPIPANQIPLKTPSFRCLGLKGGAKSSPVVVKLFYDFKPRLTADSLLLTEPISWSMGSITATKEAASSLTPGSSKMRLSEEATLKE